MSANMSESGASPGDGDATQSETDNVSQRYVNLMERFSRVLFKLDGDSEFSDAPIMEAAYEQCIRLKIWGLQNRVSAPDDAPGSMGGLLKEKPKAQELVFEVNHHL